MAVALDADRFGERLRRLYSSWQENSEAWGKATAIVAAAGSAAEDIRYWKSSSIYLWLLGYEFTDTILIFTKKEIHALAGTKKTTILSQLEAVCQAQDITLKLHVKPKKEDGLNEIKNMLDILISTGSDASPAVVGTFPKEKPTGTFGNAWTDELGKSQMTVVDIGHAVGYLLASKDADEVRNVKKAAYLASNALQLQGIKDIEDTIDQDKKVKHSKIAANIDEAITNPAKINLKLKQELVDVAYAPLIQSGGKYDFKLSAISNDDKLDYGVICCQVGARYASYCANVGRTYFIDPKPKQKNEYQAVVDAQAAAIAALVDGAKMSSAYEAAISVLNDKNMVHLAEKIPKNVGHVVGLELRDSTNALNATNSNLIKAGMTFNVSIGITGLNMEDSEETYAILVADTVIVQPNGASPEVATLFATKTAEDIIYYLEDGEEDSEGDEEVQEQAAPVAVRKSARTENIDFKAREEERRRMKENQEDLLERVNEATLAALSKDGKNLGQMKGQGKKVTDIVAYRSVAELQQYNALAVQVDHKRECILVPIYGLIIPFHILTVKNAVNNQDNDHAYIRINFNFGPSSEPGTKFPQMIFVKELSYRTNDIRHAAKVVQEIKALRSQVLQREKEKAERATLVKQEKLIRGKGRIYALPDVWIRPAFGGKGRKMAGTVEAHSNGFRYTSPRGEELDVMYRNIKHAFFQPAENDMITLIHFHLLDPIMVGKKKTQDVQFYTEVMDTVQTLDSVRRSMYDPDEIEEEQRERERRNKINKQYSQFVKRVQQDIWERDYGDLNLEFEIPFRELGFHGVPARSTSFIMPTVNCLVELTEMPFTVITLSEVNLVNLERVGFNLRNFDMVFIWKDLNREVGRIDAIPSKNLETIKDWLNSIEIKFYESKVNLNWKNIAKSIREDPEGFVENGGWSFLDADASDSEEEEEEMESEFEPSEEEESDEDLSSEDESMEEEDSDESEFELDSEEEEGLDWDELEEQARKEDKIKHYSDDEETRRRKKKARR